MRRAFFWLERQSRRLAHFFLFGAEREVDTKIDQREKHVPSFSEANTLRCGRCVAEGEAELTAHLSDNRALSFKMLNSMMMTRGVERGWLVCRWWTSPV